MEKIENKILDLKSQRNRPLDKPRHRHYLKVQPGFNWPKTGSNAKVVWTPWWKQKITWSYE